MSEDRFAELREALGAEGLTPGPWMDGHTHDPWQRSREVRAVEPGYDDAWEHAATAVGVIDSAAAARFIAAADPSTIAALLASLAAAEEREQRLREALRLALRLDGAHLVLHEIIEPVTVYRKSVGTHLPLHEEEPGIAALLHELGVPNIYPDGLSAIGDEGGDDG